MIGRAGVRMLVAHSRYMAMRDAIFQSSFGSGPIWLFGDIALIRRFRVAVPYLAMHKAPRTIIKATDILPVDELVRLGEAAVIELERRGYSLRGKSALQIKRILRFPPPKAKAKR